MDVADIRNLMRKTQASILLNGFLGKRPDDLGNVSFADWLSSGRFWGTSVEKGTFLSVARFRFSTSR